VLFREINIYFYNHINTYIQGVGGIKDVGELIRISLLSEAVMLAKRFWRN
jgi:hypothetical protein